MAAPDRSGFDRRASVRSPVRFSMQPEADMSDDDYDMEAMGVSDGFRPTGTANQTPARISIHEHPNRLSSPPPRPSSMTKPRFDNLALRHDGSSGNTAALPMGFTGMGSGSTADAITRSSSISTDAPFMRPESPYRGPSAPSHPYQMYPQDARLARTASVATTSTFQPSTERQYAGPSGPTHPYGMYPQGTVPEAEQDQITPIPVGFPGRPNEYHRRLGPEGEEAADIIGPDGHTEQLPPYSQYPDEAFARKNRGMASVPTQVAAPIATLVPTTEGAGGIGLATRNPEFASTEDLSLHQSRMSSRSNTTDMEDHRSNGAAYDASEKQPEKKWKVIAQRKLWGIVPVWVLVLAGTVVLLFAIITGTALGVINAKRKDGPKPQKDQTSENSSASPVTTTFDATPLSSVPTGLPTLSLGTFALPINTPNTAGQTCLSSSTQYNTWSCNIPFSMMSMSVSPVGSGNSLRSYKMSIKSDLSASEFLYGTQPPNIAVEQIMDLVNDSNAKQYGPAWFFQLAYNKLVIVGENGLTVPSKRSPNPKKNQDNDSFDDFTRRRGVAIPGDKPWFCYWNNTLLEAFIYPNASSAAGAANSASATTGSSSAPTGSASVSPSRTSSSQTSTGSAASAQSSASGSMPPMLQIYPNIVRIEERRMPSTPESTSPYCQKMQILDNGRAVPWLDTSGQPVTVVLNETDPSGLRLRSATGLYQRDATDYCNCVWITT